MGYNKDALLLVIPTMTYSKKVLVGSKIIDRALGMITKGELVGETVTWKQAHFGAVMFRLLQLPYKGARGIGALQRGSLLP